MKRLTNFGLISMILMIGTLSSCRTSVSVSVLRPADITLPGHINKLTIANRSLPSKDNKVLNILEGILSGEGIFMDRIGSDECLVGLSDALVKTPRFDVVRPAGVELKGTGTAAFPTALGWSQVQKICDQNSADALILLEALDSDSRIKYSMRDKESKDKEGNKVVIVEHTAELRMSLTTGWRIYDPKTKSIVDEFKSTDYMDFHGHGKSPDDARGHLPHKRDVVNRTGFFAGSQYGMRIAPMWIRVSRSYYNKGCESLKKAARMAKVNNWKGAAGIWKNMAERSQVPKIKGRATYNMALASEVEGKLDIALMWAKKAYEECNMKKARSYARVLERRIADEERVKKQMGGKGA